MTLSIILVIVYSLLAITLSYAYIRLSIAKEEKNKLLKSKIDADSKNNKDELNSYKTAIKVIESYINKEDGKRVALSSENDTVLGILSRCGFNTETINDVEEHKNKKEIVFKLKCDDLISVFNRNIN